MYTILNLIDGELSRLEKFVDALCDHFPDVQYYLIRQIQEHWQVDVIVPYEVIMKRYPDRHHEGTYRSVLKFEAYIKGFANGWDVGDINR